MSKQAEQLALPVGAPTRAVARRTDPETSREAAKRVDVTKGQAAVLSLFLRHGAMSDWALVELADQWGLQMSPSGLRSRRAELVKAGYLRDSGERAVWSNPDGSISWRRTAIVWERTGLRLEGER